MENTPGIRSARETIRNNSGLISFDFLTVTSELIRDMIKTYETELQRIKQELSLIEDAGLHILRKGERSYYYIYDNRDRSRRSINDDPERIHRLARRAYMEKLILLIQDRIRRLYRVLENTEGLLYESRMKRKLEHHSLNHLDICRILFSKEQNEWIDKPYSPDPFHQENLIYQTRGGILMRSKSEVRIGNRLEEIGVPYRYDDLVNIRYTHGFDKPFNNSYFADFKIPNLLGGITIHEHFGAFQIGQYSDNALKKMNDYRNFTVYEFPSRIVKPEEFTWSLEADLRDPTMFKTIIHRMLLPFRL